MSKPVAILCGGLGTRLGSDTQKCLTPVNGRPFLHWKLDQLTRSGATDFHLLVAHQAAEVESSIGATWGDIPVDYHLDSGLGQAEAHLLAAPYLPFTHWLTYGDCILDAPLRHSLCPYVYVNEEFPWDAGLRYCWGASTLAIPKRTSAQSIHINTPANLEQAHANLR